MTRLMIGTAAAAIALAPSCTALESPSEKRATPTEAETRDAYFGTPAIVDEVGAAVPRGITRRQLFRRLGVARIVYGRTQARRRACVVYPILGTQRWDQHGSPVAREWEYCFDSDGRLATKRRVGF